MKKIIIKNHFQKDWVTREAGEKLRDLIISYLSKGEHIDLDFSNMTIASVSFFDEGFAKLKLEKKLPKDWEKLIVVSSMNQWDQEVLNTVNKERGIKISVSNDPIKSHPWRICPLGEHYVKAHEKKTKTGKVGHWDAQCRKNPSGKEIYTSDEIHEISKKFNGLELPYPSKFKKEDWNRFDNLIAGWTKFWNDTFGPVEKLSPNFVKALIASESSFKTGAVANNKKSIGQAQGLVQITEATSKLISPQGKELSDHQFDLGKSDIFDPNINLCVATRWLFRKRAVAHERLGRLPTWFEVLEEYKGILTKETQEAEKQRKILTTLLSELGEKF